MAAELRNPLHDSSIKESAQEKLRSGQQSAKKAFEQFSDRASDFYNRANTWVNQGHNRDYSYLALIATVGLVGFMIGRSAGNQHSTQL